jgi:uncharacterized coiled-coil DUF342 family protein
MKHVAALAVSLLAATSLCMNPLEKCLELFGDVEATVTKDGENEEGAYKLYFEWCDDMASELAHQIKVATGQKRKLEAKLAKATATRDECDTRIEELAGIIAQHEKDLKDAEERRLKEAKIYKMAEQELLSSISQLERAGKILEKMMRGGASFMQSPSPDSSIGQELRFLSTEVDALGMTSQDSQKLSSFIQGLQDRAQETEDEREDELALGAPAAAVYEKKSGGLVELIDELRDKAETQLRELRTNEVKAKQNYGMISQSLKAQLAASKTEFDDEKSSKASAEQEIATAEGELDVTNRELTNAQESLKSTRAGCIQHAADHQASIASRKEELKVLAKAKQTLINAMGPAADRTYSFLQVAAKVSSSDSASAADGCRRVMEAVRALALRHQSNSLEQLASRIGAAAKLETSKGGDPFKKVKGMLTDMIAKLQDEMAKEAQEKEYCDNEMAKTNAAFEELTDRSDMLKSKIDQATSASLKLQTEVRDISASLAELAKLQKMLDDTRTEEHKGYVTAKADLEQGLDGVQRSIQTLRDYYAKSDQDDEAAASSLIQASESGGDTLGDMMSVSEEQPKQQMQHKPSSAADSIIGLLEIVQSDISKNVAAIETEESDSQSQYEATSKETALSKVAKQKDIQYKTKEYKGLDKTVNELSTDHETVTQQLAAVTEYLAQLKERCVAKPETYEMRKERREQEIQGLREAAVLLKAAPGFLQARTKQWKPAAQPRARMEPLAV